MKGLLSVSFGTSYEATREKTIDAVDARLAEEFPDRAFYSAWTSGRIVAKVRAERGEHHDTLEEAFARLSAEGVDDLAVATMCLMQGHEMEKVCRAARAWLAEGAGRTVRIADPLLANEEDRSAMARIICEEFAGVPDGEALVLMGHGSQDAPTERDGKPYDANAVYSQVQAELNLHGRPRFFVATVEGQPTFEDALAEVAACGAKRVHLAPFMMVAGDHATNDLAGDDDDSWKGMLESHGFETEVVLRGLGEYAAVHELICEHVRAALAAE